MPRLTPFQIKDKSRSGDGKNSRPGAKRRMRRPAPAKWRKPTLIVSGIAVVLAGIAAGGYMVWTEGWVQRQVVAANLKATGISRSLGFTVRKVTVEGRRETDREDLVDALDIAIGDPILSVDIAAARLRVEALGWVKTARIDRLLPDSIQLVIEERTAVAIWQQNGAFTLIDPDGAPIGSNGLERYGHLKVLVGNGAPDQAVALLRVLESEPDLMARVTGAVWVSARRWNLRLDNGIDVRLPEDDPSRAWNRLAQLERDYGLLGRAIKAIDLRQTDRMIVRMTEEAAEMRRARKDET